ncbi:AMP-binding protein [Actinomadura darangshiensis]|uniref:AMP-binding protein n=1 Tax=Actinomadura darangshiensis TaxID=705336 RepID=A0A4R5A6S1_9ACTN|nr:protein kinase family protein [Actinomadura darangshiensis]TDD67783.1 AMP-binding protein [Actinomadura darangshiensis]
MSTSVIEPGTRLAGRYRLEERISDSGGSSLWKAIDEILARAVAVRTFDPEFPRVAEAVTSARSASRLTDPRLTQVFDADDSGESAYIVSEWVAGEPLEGMLNKAPLEPGRAATLLYEGSEAIAAAHAAGLSHLCLTPRDLVWTTGGTVKLLGVATDAVLADRQCDDPAAEDVRGLGRMLYAALTAHWPGDEAGSGLPAAPASDGVPHAPRQVQAGISHAIDAIVCRCLGLGAAEPLATPADLAKALRGVPRTPLPLFAGLGHTPPAAPRPAAPRRPATPSTAATTQPHHPPAEPAASSQVPPPRARRQRHAAPPAPPASSTRTTPAHGHGAPKRHGNRALLGVAAAALTVIVGIGAWALTGTGGDGGGDDGGPTDKGKTSAPPASAAAKLDVQDIRPVELRTSQGNGDKAIGKGIQSVVDGKPTGTWETQTYADAEFGKLSKGLGVLLDMGKPVKIANVKIHSPVAGGLLQVRAGDSQTPSDLQRVGEQTPNGGELTITANPQATGRYVLVWFTKLPSGSFKGRLGEITVYGAAG